MEAVIFIGIQASGKTTFYKERFFNSHLRINLDMLKTRHRESILLNACIKAKQRFVIDNTNTKKAERQKYIVAAKQANFKIIGYYFQTEIQDAIRRNASRPSREVIPEVGIRGTYKHMELPDLTEGFDELFRVRIGDNGEFIVRKWKTQLSLK